MANSAVLAAALPAFACGSTCARRAARTANSAPTKKALVANSTTSQTIPHQSLAIGRPVVGGVTGVGCGAIIAAGAVGRSADLPRYEAQAIDPQAVHPQHRQGSRVQLDGVTAFGNLAELGHHEATDGVVILVLVDDQADSLLHLIE